MIAEARTFEARGASRKLFRWLKASREDQQPFPPPLPVGDDRFHQVREVLLEGPANTGKSRAVCEFIRLFCEWWPGVRVLVLRATRRALTESFCVTFEDDVLGEGHPALGNRAREGRASYAFPNGSRVVLAGLDQPTKTYSAQYDLIYVQEATEVGMTEDKYQALLRALRNKKAMIRDHPDPAQRVFMAAIIADCNPSAPTHWVNVRCEQGLMIRMLTRHDDNPVITEQDKDALRSLRGVLRARLWEGKWVAAEGLVWPEFTPATHIVPRSLLHKQKIAYRIAGMDFGFSAPGTMQLWAVDHEGRMWLENELYARGRTEEWWAERAVAWVEAKNVREVVCDSAQPQTIHRFNQLARMQGVGQVFRRAQKQRSSASDREMAGVAAVRWALGEPTRRINPRMFFVADALEFADRGLLDDKQPTCVVQELPLYAYRMAADGRAQRDTIDPDCADHGCDVLRYVATRVFGRDPESMSGPPPPDPRAIATGDQLIGELNAPRASGGSAA